MCAAGVQDGTIGVGRYPLVALIGHDVVRCCRVIERPQTCIEADLADRGLAAAVLGIVWIVVGVSLHRDVLPAVNVPQFVRERQGGGRETAPNTLGLATTAVDPQVAGYGLANPFPRNRSARDHSEDDVAELQQRAEYAHHLELTQQLFPELVA